MDDNRKEAAQDAGNLTEFATEYMVCALPREHPDFAMFAITVGWRGSMVPDQADLSWAVLRRGKCLSDKGEWHLKPSPSNRTELWMQAHRFTLDEALARARQAAPHVTVNGHTVGSVH